MDSIWPTPCWNGSEGKTARGAIDTFDHAGYAALMRRIQAAAGAETVYAPRFDRGIEESIGSAIEVLPEVPLVITEGNYLLQQTGSWPQARECMAEVWYLEVPDAERQKRLTDRHRSYGKTSGEARQWALGSDEANAHVVAASALYADRMLRLQ